MEKIAIYVPSLAGGGAERVMLNLANEFARQGYQVDLVLASTRGQYLDLIRHEVNVIDLNCARVLRSVLGLIRYLRREKPDAMISALEHANVVSVLSSLVSRTSTKVIITEHNTFSRNMSGMRPIVKTLLPKLIKLFYIKASNIVSVSQGVAQDMFNTHKIPLNKIEVIYNPVDSKTLLSKASETVTHPWLQSDQPPLIISVGRLVPAKDHETLLRAFALVRNNVKARLIILGEGKEHENLLALRGKLGLDNVVDFPGFVDNPYPFIAKSRAFVLSSRWEGFPVVLIEALVLGATIISTDCESGPREALKQGEYGTLVPVGDVESLAMAITKSITSPKKVLPKEAWLQYDIARIAERYLQLVRS